MEYDFHINSANGLTGQSSNPVPLRYKINRLVLSLHDQRHKKKLLLFLFGFVLVFGIFPLIPGISAGSEMHSLEISFSFTAPDYPNKQLTGYPWKEMLR